MPTRRDFLVRAGVAGAATLGACHAAPLPSSIGETEEGMTAMSVRFSRVLTTGSRSTGTLSVASLELEREQTSPLLVFDDFRVSGRPFGPHPHAGFSAVTYVFRDSPGSLRNRDSLGGHVVVGPGGIAWLHAGSGAQHEEIPADAGLELRGLQVFVNLSAENKRSAPRALSLAAERVPVWRSPNGDDVVRVVVGSYRELTSELVPVEPFTLLDVELHHEVDVTLADRSNTIFYVRRGTAVLAAGDREQRLSEGQAVVASGAGAVRASTGASAEVLVLSGRELREAIVMGGPFVMNDASEIEAAAARFRAGGMGRLEPWTG